MSTTAHPNPNSQEAAMSAPTGTHTIHAGFEMIRWVDSVTAGYAHPFHATGDVQRAYDRGGWEAVRARCEEALDVLADPRNAGLYDVWYGVWSAATQELVEAS
jgi:hypothetical protein